VAHAVAVAHHDRQRDQAHRDHRGGDGAGDGAHDRADEDHRIAEAAPYATEELAEAFEQVFGEAALFKDDTHQGEERHGQQQVVGEHAVELVGEVAEKFRFDQVELQGGDAEEQADRAERKGRRIADQHEQHEAAKHQRRHVGPDQIHHCTGFS
jgi:hypothetical protein